MEKTDEKVLAYLKQIEAAELEIKNAEKPKWLTTCIIKFEGETINFNTLGYNEVIELVTRLLALKNNAKLATEFLGVPEEKVTIGNNTLDEILTDLKSRMGVVTLKDKKAKLVRIKKELETKLSKDKSNEIEVDKLGDALGGLLDI